jgi:hypothetical protein
VNNELFPFKQRNHIVRKLIQLVVRHIQQTKMMRAQVLHQIVRNSFQPVVRQVNLLQQWRVEVSAKKKKKTDPSTTTDNPNIPSQQTSARESPISGCCSAAAPAAQTSSTPTTESPPAPESSNQERRLPGLFAEDLFFFSGKTSETRASKQMMLLRHTLLHRIDI